MKTPSLQRHVRAGATRHRGTDAAAKTVQEFLRAAALVNHGPGSAAYFPENFLTRW